MRLTVEQLEPRENPNAAGLPWVDPLHLTLSFAPDGAPTGPSLSGLAATLDRQVATGDWRLEILRAFQTWAVNANLNVGLVADDGLPLGTPGLVQGDPRFGDLRVAGVPLGGPQVANTTPFQATGGTWSGDVLINTRFRFGLGDPAAYDLFSVALHEAGHAFGLGESGEPLSAMFDRYLGPRAALGAGDIAALQALYGPRQGDEFDAKPNDTLQSASLVSPRSSSAGDITTLDDVDYYRFMAPIGKVAATLLNVRVRTSGISLLAPTLTVYDGAGNVVGTAAADGPAGGDLSVTIAKPRPGGVYFVRVGSAARDVFGIGSYEMSLGTFTGLNTPSKAAQAEFYADNRENDALATATRLTQKNAGGTTLTFGFAGSISDGSDVDFYRVHSPQASGGIGPVMTALVSASDSDGLAPRVEVFDAAGRPVLSQVVSNSGGFFSVQVHNPLPDADYYVMVSSLAPAGGPQATGNYFLGVDFASEAGVELDQAASGALSSEAPRQSQDLSVGRSGSFHFVLSAAGATQVRMDVYDASGALVYSLAATANEPATSGQTYLAAGQYTVVFTAALEGVATPLTYSLRSVALSDPIGPVLVGTTPAPAPTVDYVWDSTSYLVFDPVYSWIDPYYYY
jgi:hypothetical protein